LKIEKLAKLVESGFLQFELTFFEDIKVVTELMFFEKDGLSSVGGFLTIDD